MKRSSVALIAVCALGLVGCGTAQQPASAPAAATMAGPAPLDAAMVTPAFGWVLTPDELLISQDGGATLRAVNVPVPKGAARAAYFTDDRTGVVAAATGESIKVAATENGGRTWRTTTLRGSAPTPAGYSSLRMSFGDAARGAILARAATSAAFSLATIFTTTDGAATWSAHEAPEAGTVSVQPDGRIWLAGAALHSTTDQGQSWVRSELALAGPFAAATVSTPIIGSAPATVPVTVITGEHSEAQLLTSTDGGRTWSGPARIPVHGKTGPGVRLASVNTSAGPLVYDTVAGHAYRRDGTDLRPAGLPDGVQAVTFAADSQHGWTLAGYGACGAGKQDCQYHHDLLATTDGGATWHPIATWTRPVT